RRALPSIERKDRACPPQHLLHARCRASACVNVPMFRTHALQPAQYAGGVHSIGAASAVRGTNRSVSRPHYPGEAARQMMYPLAGLDEVPPDRHRLHLTVIWCGLDPSTHYMTE